LPAAPPELTRGVVLWEHAGFRGKSIHIFASVGSISMNLWDYKGPCATFTKELDSDYDPEKTLTWDDCVSSVQIAPGWRVTLYEDLNSKGVSYTAAADVPDLRLVPAGTCLRGYQLRVGGLDDCVSSVRVDSPQKAAPARRARR
jgi:hypothetical protein